MVGGPRSEAKLLADIVAVDEQDLDRFDPQLLRDRAALGRALLAGGEIAAAIEALSRAVSDSIPSHPDTNVYCTALVEACDVAEARGRKRELQAAEAARHLLTDEGAPTST
jgi:hypothetical protein